MKKDSLRSFYFGHWYDGQHGQNEWEGKNRQLNSTVYFFALSSLRSKSPSLLKSNIFVKNDDFKLVKSATRILFENTGHRWPPTPLSRALDKLYFDGQNLDKPWTEEKKSCKSPYQQLFNDKIIIPCSRLFPIFSTIFDYKKKSLFFNKKFFLSKKFQCFRKCSF